MGRAYKCDICKQCFPISLHSTGQAYHVSIEDFMKDRSPECSFDICPACYEDLKKKVLDKSK